MPRQFVSPDTYTPAMKATVDRLRRESIPFEIISRYHLKSGIHNYYPDRGRIYSDGDFQAAAGSGLDAFVSVVRRQTCPDA